MQCSALQCCDSTIHVSNLTIILLSCCDSPCTCLTWSWDSSETCLIYAVQRLAVLCIHDSNLTIHVSNLTIILLSWCCDGPCTCLTWSWDSSKTCLCMQCSALQCCDSTIHDSNLTILFFNKVAAIARVHAWHGAETALKHAYVCSAAPCSAVTALYMSAI